jgi:hypothetical protein
MIVSNGIPLKSAFWMLCVTAVALLAPPASTAQQSQKTVQLSFGDQENSERSGQATEASSSAQTEDVVEENLSDERNSLADSLPTAVLRGGINIGSMQRAVAKRDIVDPNLSYVQSASWAPAEYRLGSPVVWKTWTSPDLCHNPLYFEQANAERYGIDRTALLGHNIQPIASGIHFFGSVAALPYKMGSQRPNTCDCGPDTSRLNNCDSATREQQVLSREGLSWQALATLAIIFGL